MNKSRQPDDQGKRHGRFLRLEIIVWVIVSLFFLLIPKITRSDYYLDILILALMWASLAGAYNISGGYAGQFSLGHSAFMGIGAYTSTILAWKLGISPWLGMIPGALLAALTALFLGGVVFRLRGPFLGLATLAFGEVVQIIAVNWRSLTRGSEGIGIPFKPGFANFIFADKSSYYYIALCLCAGIMLITWLIARSRIGYHLIAVRENEDAARALGVYPTVVKIFALVLSAILTALGGTFYAQYILYIDPSSLISFDVSIQFPLIAVVGGVGTILGPLVGAGIVVPMAQILRSTFSGAMSGLDQALFGLILILVVFFIPRGLVPEFQKRIRSRHPQGPVAKFLERISLRRPSVRG
jgi:branched-chain amino acid transport system permease protein